MTIYLGEATPNLAMSTLASPPLGVEIALIAKIYFSKTFGHNFIFIFQNLGQSVT